MAKSFRAADMAREKILAEYLNNTLYTKTAFSDFLRTNDKENQLSGSDCRLSIPSKNIFNIVIDEKAQLYYLDGGLPTFAFELNFLLNSGQRVEGWLTNQSKITQYYNLLFLTAEEDFTNFNQIHKVEYIFVSREAILNFISKHGLAIDTLKERGLQVSQCSDFRQFQVRGIPFYFTHSIKLSESPVNIILRKSDLIKLSVLHGFI